MPERNAAPLLDQVQVYLAARLEQLAPDALLTHCWEQFYRLYNVIILAFARRCGLSAADAEDIAQEVWLEAWQRLPEF